MARYEPKYLDRDLRTAAVRLFLAAVALTGIAALGGTAARYWAEWGERSLVTAGNFYFASQGLDGALHTEAAAADGYVRFSFDLRNYLVKGHPTESAVEYTCTVTDSGNGAVADTKWQEKDGTTITAGVAGGVLSETFPAKAEGADTCKARELTCAIPVSAFGDGREKVTVTVASKKPYAKVLTAQVALSEGSGDVRLVVTDPGRTSGAVYVTLFDTGSAGGTGAEEKKDRCTVSWDLTSELVLVPDPTWEPKVELNADKKSFTVDVSKGEAVTVVLLKKFTTRTYSENDLALETVEVPASDG